MKRTGNPRISNAPSSQSETQSERDRFFDIAVGVAAGKAERKRDQFRGEPAGSFVLERELTLFDRFITPGKFEQFGPFLVQRASLTAPLGVEGAPFSESLEMPRNVAALVVAPSPNLTNEQIASNPKDPVGTAKFIRAPVFIVGRRGALFRADPNGTFQQVR